MNCFFCLQVEINVEFAEEKRETNQRSPQSCAVTQWEDHVKGWQKRTTVSTQCCSTTKDASCCHPWNCRHARDQGGQSKQNRGKVRRVTTPTPSVEGSQICGTVLVSATSGCRTWDPLPKPHPPIWNGKQAQTHVDVDTEMDLKNLPPDQRFCWDRIGRGSRSECVKRTILDDSNQRVSRQCIVTCTAICLAWKSHRFNDRTRRKCHHEAR